MSKSAAKQCVVSSAGGALTCLVMVVLLVAVRPRGSPPGRDVPRDTPSLQNTDHLDPPADNRSGGKSPQQQPTQVKVFSAYINKLTRGKRAVDGRPRTGEPPPAEDLTPADLFLAVKTTQKYHRSRLDLLAETWISRNMQQTYVFTDGEDEILRKRLGSHLINTNCSALHSRHALSCKMAVEYDTFITSGRKWFCHVDDDNYVNVRPLVALLSHYDHAHHVYLGRPSLDRPIEATERLGDAHTRPVRFWFATGGAGFCISRGLALKMSPWASGGHFMSTAERIRLPDDCTVGYIVEALLGVGLTRSPLFHSHLENLQLVFHDEIHKQVTLSYGTFESNRNIVNVRGAFSLDEDPSRFRSIHCLLYPDTPWCPAHLSY